MRFNDFKLIAEAQFNSKQEVIDHFVKQGKSAAAGASAWERGWRGHTPKKKEPTGPVRNYHDDLDDKRYGEVDEDSDPCWKNYKQIGMKKKGGKQVPNCVPKESVESLEAQLAEAAIGTAPKRPGRPGSRPARGHEAAPRYKKVEKSEEEQFCEDCGGSLAEAGKASRALCVSSKADSELGASQLASCKSQGLRAREGKKSHKIGKTRVVMGGKKVKGRQYGGPIPDWSE